MVIAGVDIGIMVPNFMFWNFKSSQTELTSRWRQVMIFLFLQLSPVRRCMILGLAKASITFSILYLNIIIFPLSLTSNYHHSNFPRIL